MMVESTTGREADPRRGIALMSDHALTRIRPWIASAAAAALGVGLWIEHAPGSDPGISVEDLDALTVTANPVGGPFTGALVLDMVEPDDGEGGSEAEIAEYLAELADVSVEPAGFYSEGEHLFRVEGDLDALRTLHATAAAHELVEGVEWEVLYALPDDAVAAGAPPPSAAETGPQRPGEDRFVPNDPMFPLQWHMDQIHAPQAWTKTRGEGVIVAVVDSGVAFKDGHGVKAVPDLAGTRFTAGKTFINGATPDGLDDHAHGTHVAGTIAQTTNNGVGVTGVANEATIMPLKVLSAKGSGSVPGIANAIRYAADEGAQVINMSLGSALPSRVLAKAIEYAHHKGVTVVCASGNDGRGRVGYPAASEHAVAVGAVDYTGDLTFYSNYGKAQDIAAPGGDIREDKNGDGYPDGVLQNTIRIQLPAENDYLWFMGTSMASPHAAGVAALVISEGVTNPDEVERILKETAVHPDGIEWDKKYGAGVIDAAAAVEAATNDYAPERGGFALLGLLGLAGLGAAGAASRRARVLAAGGLVSGVALASGALGTTPMAYGLASWVGGTASATAGLLAFSVAVPLALTLMLLSVRSVRGLLIGFSVGYAALLAHAAFVLPTLLTGLPGGPTVDRLWLGLHAMAALWLARRTSRL